MTTVKGRVASTFVYAAVVAMRSKREKQALKERKASRFGLLRSRPIEVYVDSSGVIRTEINQNSQLVLA